MEKRPFKKKQSLKKRGEEMAKKMTCEYGKISLLKKNPRDISGSSFRRLDESVEQRPFMLEARGIVLWQVPPEVPEDSPFAGQAGELVVIGGNQRLKALQKQGYESIPSKWVTLAKTDGEWWSPEDAEFFVLMDNNPDGIAGTFAYDRMLMNFDKQLMASAGIDVSNFAFEEQKDITDELNVEDEVEASSDGEKDEDLEGFIERREKKRKDLPELAETGFYLNLVFETHGQKMEFLEKAGITDQVEYEMFVDGIEFAKHKMGIEIERSGLHFPDRHADPKLADLAMENPQEPHERTEESLKHEFAEDAKDYESALSWIKEHETAAPYLIQNRLKVFKEWAEEELTFAKGMLNAIEEKAKEDVDKKEAERKSQAAYAAAFKERSDLGMVNQTEDGYEI